MGGVHEDGGGVCGGGAECAPKKLNRLHGLNKENTRQIWRQICTAANGEWEVERASLLVNDSKNDWRVEISQEGRGGSVVYYEGSNAISCYWEFGGGDVVAFIHVGEPAEWRKKCAWAAERKPEIAERIAKEVIRQRAPTCRADIEDEYIYVRDLRR